MWLTWWLFHEWWFLWLPLELLFLRLSVWPWTLIPILFFKRATAQVHHLSIVRVDFLFSLSRWAKERSIDRLPIHHGRIERFHFPAFVLESLPFQKGLLLTRWMNSIRKSLLWSRFALWDDGPHTNKEKNRPPPTHRLSIAWNSHRRRRKATTATTRWILKKKHVTAIGCGGSTVVRSHARRPPIGRGEGGGRYRVF